jgi:hypothetical protein
MLLDELSAFEVASFYLNKTQISAETKNCIRFRFKELMQRTIFKIVPLTVKESHSNILHLQF